ncbi:MAG: ATP synthase F1 subunit gamma [Thermoplasmata archaeon]|nr:MAG: ATP synthase F1 subunit gamma [Thermoplasmata archaeon]
MPSLVAIKRRIKSAGNISQITKAMEMVSASKMKKAQDSTMASRPFADKLESIIENISHSGSTVMHPLMRHNDNPQNAMLIIVSTNKGLCGGLNVNLFRKISQWEQEESSHLKLNFVHVHKKAKSPIPKTKESEIVALFHELGEKPSFEESRSIAKLAIEAFTAGDVDEVYIAYPKFISTLVNEPTIKRILPIRTTQEKSLVNNSNEYVFEPSMEELLQKLVPYQVEMSIFQIITEASASEHSARMVAMKSASDNASELIDNLTLDYNQARQTAVTTELLDATTARMALAN